MYGLFTYIWLISEVNVGRYTSPMDPMGKVLQNGNQDFIPMKKHRKTRAPQWAAGWLPGISVNIFFMRKEYPP